MTDWHKIAESFKNDNGNNMNCMDTSRLLLNKAIKQLLNDILYDEMDWTHFLNAWSCNIPDSNKVSFTFHNSCELDINLKNEDNKLEDVTFTIYKNIDDATLLPSITVQVSTTEPYFFERMIDIIQKEKPLQAADIIDTDTVKVFHDLFNVMCEAAVEKAFQESPVLKEHKALTYFIKSLTGKEDYCWYDHNEDQNYELYLDNMYVMGIQKVTSPKCFDKPVKCHVPYHISIDFLGINITEDYLGFYDLKMDSFLKQLYNKVHYKFHKEHCEKQIEESNAKIEKAQKELKELETLKREGFIG